MEKEGYRGVISRSTGWKHAFSLGHSSMCLNAPAAAELARAAPPIQGWYVQGIRNIARNTGSAIKRLSNARFPTSSKSYHKLGKKGFGEPAGGGLAPCGS